MRKARSDSESEAVRIGTSLSMAHEKLMWPNMIPPALNENVRDLELAIFESTLTSRAPTDWSSYEIISVARLAGHVAMQIKDEDNLKRFGTLIKSPNNNQQFIRNPLLDAISTRQAVINQLCRQIGVSLPSVDVNALNSGGRTAQTMNVSANILSLIA